MLKKILIAVLALIVLLVATVVILAFAVKTDVKVEREVTINRPKAEVFNYVKRIKNQSDWGTWVKKDPHIKLDYRGADGAPGFVSSWKSDNAEIGAGEQEIKKVVEGERLDTQLRFTEPFDSTADAYITTEPLGAESTKVKWGFSTTMPRPLNVMCLVVDMDKEVGNDFEAGLSNLKRILETPPTVN